EGCSFEDFHRGLAFGILAAAKWCDIDPALGDEHRERLVWHGRQERGASFGERRKVRTDRPNELESHLRVIDEESSNRLDDGREVLVVARGAGEVANGE